MPEQTQIISRKKLALTIGIKAAKHELLLFTDADCRPRSSFWITEVVCRFTPNTEFVLGYGAYLPQKGLLSHLISYDTLFIAMQYMGFAFRGKPYMGIGRNLAYRKETFFSIGQVTPNMSYCCLLMLIVVLDPRFGLQRWCVDLHQIPNLC